MEEEPVLLGPVMLEPVLPLREMPWISPSAGVLDILSTVLQKKFIGKLCFRLFAGWILILNS